MIGCWGFAFIVTSLLNRRFEFHKRGQLFIRTHNETLSIAAMARNTGFHLWFGETPIGSNEKPEAVEVGVEADLSGHGLPLLVGVLAQRC